MLDIVYGKELLRENDPYMGLADIMVPAFIEAALPGKFLVDILPALKYIPAWVPGAGFQRKAARWSEVMVKICEDPWNEAKAKLVCVIIMASVFETNTLVLFRKMVR